MKKRVLFCVPPNCGGAERVTLTIAKLLDRELYDVTIVIVGKTKGEIIKFIPSYFDVVHVKIRNIWDFTTFRLVRLFRKICPDIVFCSLIYLNIRVLLAAHIVGRIKTIVRSNIGLYRLRTDIAFLAKKVYPLADAIILQSDEMKMEFLKWKNVHKERLHVIFNPIDIDSIEKGLRQSSSPYDSRYINYVFVGRIDYCKGLDVLLEAFAELIKSKENSRLHLIGKIIESDSYYCKLKQQVAMLGLDEYVSWKGFTPNPYPYIKYADCLVLPSRVEGLPNVVLDAMYLHIPVVVTRSVPVIDRLVPSTRGIVINVEDVESLQRAMKQVLKMKIEDDYHQSSITELLTLFK